MEPDILAFRADSERVVRGALAWELVLFARGMFIEGIKVMCRKLELLGERVHYKQEKACLF